MYLAGKITRLRGTDTAGDYGGNTIDWSSPTPADYAAEVFAPSSTEDVSLAERVDAQYVVQAEAAADIQPTDRVDCLGDTYEVASGVEKLAIHGRVLQLRFLIRKVTGG